MGSSTGSPPFTRFAVSRAVSWAGNSLTLVALPVLVYQRTSDPLLTGLLAACEGLPYLLLGLPAGALVDRWGARRTMLVTTLLSALVTAAVPLADLLGALSTAQLLLTAFLTSSLFVFFDAGSFGAVPAIVGRDGIGPALARLSGISTVIGLAGPALAGVLLTVLRPPQVLALDAVSYGLSVLLLLTVHWSSAPVPRRGLFAEIGEGLRYVWDHHLVRVLTLIGVGGSLAGGVVTGLLVVLAARRFGLGAGDLPLGVLYAAGPAGALLATFVVNPLQRHVAVGRLSLASWSSSALVLAVVVVAGTWWAAALALLAWQTASTLAILNAIVVRQTVTPMPLQARVNTTARMIAWGGQPLGAAVGGAVTAWSSLEAGLGLAVACTAASVVGGLLGGLHRTPRLADLTTDPATAVTAVTPVAASSDAPDTELDLRARGEPS
ncbi:MFS transporter [Kineococcus sp. LSe6-4]|uniref:MFS transporter n=1 Tax=Kineococcus halophytocola TaxID=3234027 RepID=A0ABV4H5Z7_9ACTN